MQEQLKRKEKANLDKMTWASISRHKEESYRKFLQEEKRKKKVRQIVYNRDLMEQLNLQTSLKSARKHMPNILKRMNKQDIQAFQKMDPNPYSLMPGLNSSKFRFSNPFYNYQKPS